MPWVDDARNAGYRFHAFSTSAAGIPTTTAAIDAELDPGYDLEADGLLLVGVGGVGLIIAAATVRDIVAHYISHLRLR